MIWQFIIRKKTHGYLQLLELINKEPVSYTHLTLPTKA